MKRALDNEFTNRRIYSLCLNKEPEAHEQCVPTCSTITEVWARPSIRMENRLPGIESAIIHTRR